MNEIEPRTAAYLLVDLIAAGVEEALNSKSDEVTRIAASIDSLSSVINALHRDQLLVIIDTLAGLTGDMAAGVGGAIGSVDLIRQALIDGPYSGGVVERDGETGALRYVVGSVPS